MTTPLLMIGDFAREAGLTPKALRLYDDLGLPRPVEVDPVSGYRRYARSQLDAARLVVADGFGARDDLAAAVLDAWIAGGLRDAQAAVSAEVAAGVPDATGSGPP